MKKIFWCAVIALGLFVGHVSNEMDEAKAENVEALASIPELENELEVEPTLETSYEEEDEEEKEEFYGRCMATTKKGTQCKRSAARGSHYCWQHK